MLRHGAHFEILLRNAIGGEPGRDQPQNPIRETSLMDFDVLSPNAIKQVIVAVSGIGAVMTAKPRPATQ